MREEEYYFNADEGDDMIDISSSSVKPKATRRVNEGPVKAYGNALFKNLGTIIKVISFITAFAIVAVAFVAAYFLFKMDPFFMAIALGILIVGTAIAAFTFFIIYGIGHVICQNDEILRRTGK